MRLKSSKLAYSDSAFTDFFLSCIFTAQNCSGLRTCSQCLEHPGCGWCNDPSNTGKGHCVEGSARGPVKFSGMHSTEIVIDNNLCAKEKNYEWSFIQCPGMVNLLLLLSLWSVKLWKINFKSRINFGLRYGKHSLLVSLLVYF